MKNCVTLFNGWNNRGNFYQWIEKGYRKESSLKKEYKILKLLKQNGVRVPEIYCSYDKKLFLEYIEGKTLLKYIEEFEEKNIKGIQVDRIINYLLDWLTRFYDTFSGNYIMEDINFRNFIIKNNFIYGLDFEECKPGEKERDIGRMCAFAITYYPPFSEWKKYYIKKFLHISMKYFDLDIEKIKNVYREELMAIEKRRNIKIDNNIIQKITVIFQDLNE